MEDNADGVVLLIGSGWRAYREYLLRGLSGRAALWLLDEEAPTWQLPYIAGATTVEPLPGGYPSRDNLVAAAHEVATERKVLGVVTYDEISATAAAEIAEQLGVPGLTAAGAENAKDKNRSRAVLTAAGLPQPGFALTHTLAEAAEAAERIGYPVVLKPRGMAASIGVVRATDPAGLAAAFAVSEKARHTGPPDYVAGVLVEEMVRGPEISVDGAVSGGEYQPFCLARKQLSEPPYFEEVGHVVDADDPLLHDAELLRILSRTHQALGMPDGCTHTELRLTERGPVVIEVNARLGGDMIPYVGSLATGVDPGRVAAEVALGVRPDLTPATRRTAAIRFLYPPEDCRVVSITVPAPEAVPGLVEARAIVEPGAEVRLPPRTHLGRYALLIAVADDPAGCAAVLDAAAELTDLRYEPLDMSEPFEGRPW